MGQGQLNKGRDELFREPNFDKNMIHLMHDQIKMNKMSDFIITSSKADEEGCTMVPIILY